MRFTGTGDAVAHMSRWFQRWVPCADRHLSGCEGKLELDHVEDGPYAGHGKGVWVAFASGGFSVGVRELLLTEPVCERHHGLRSGARERQRRRVIGGQGVLALDLDAFPTGMVDLVDIRPVEGRLFDV